jgi:hypothetical protein
VSVSAARVAPFAPSPDAAAPLRRRGRGAISTTGSSAPASEFSSSAIASTDARSISEARADLTVRRLAGAAVAAAVPSAVLSPALPAPFAAAPAAPRIASMRSA